MDGSQPLILSVRAQFIHRVLRTFRYGSMLTYDDIAECARTSRSTVRRAVAELVEKGALTIRTASLEGSLRAGIAGNFYFLNTPDGYTPGYDDSSHPVLFCLRNG